jgi:hypothetical protein
MNWRDWRDGRAGPDGDVGGVEGPGELVAMWELGGRIGWSAGEPVGLPEGSRKTETAGVS